VKRAAQSFQLHDKETVLDTQTLARRVFARPEAGPGNLLLLLIVIFTAINPAVLSVLSISNTLDFAVELGLITLAMTLLMTAGEFDLSVGAVFGPTPVLMWRFFNAEIMPLELAVAVSVGITASIGWVNE
jgi:simple sugar transport system permease protein